jgi:crotonobetainyl-CoA:carnitine CoA-transferase CaiB-like acyl-CoA transferase
VIKIERPGTGDDLRGYQPKWGEDSASFALLNRGKTSLALDLKNPAERARLIPQVEKADIVIEQFRPGVMDRLGLGYGDLVRIKPDLIYCAVTDYGQSGPRRSRAGHDLNYIAETGLLALAMGDRERPVVPPALIADIAGGAYPAVINILLALRYRDQTGKGALLDISMTDHLFPFMFWALGAGQATGQWPANGEGVLAGGSPRYQLYPTSDGQILAVAALEQKFWTAFCDVIGLEVALRDDGQAPDRTKDAVRRLINGMPAAHWRPLFEQVDCCCTIVRSHDEAIDDPHFRARGLFEVRLEAAGGRAMSALPVPVSEMFRAHALRPRAAPRLGAANDHEPS